MEALSGDGNDLPLPHDLLDPDGVAGGPSNNQKRKRTSPKTDGWSHDPHAESAKRIMLLLTKPSYAMKQKSESLRSYHRRRLRFLLSRLIREQNWVEACGVLSVYLTATVKDRSPENNRFKYTALFTLLQHMTPNAIASSRVQKTYDIWMRRIGCSKNASSQDRLTVHLEFVLFCLEEGDIDEAHQAAMTLLQDKRIVKNPLAHLVLGLTYYKLWYTRIPEVMKRRIDSQQGDASGWLEALKHISNTSVVHNTICNKKDLAAHGGGSDSSVMTDKRAITASQPSAKIENGEEMPAQAPVKVPVRFYLKSDENGETSSGKANLLDHGGLSCLVTKLVALPTWLLPIQPPQDLRDDEDGMQLHQFLMDNHYKDALKNLLLAFDSSSTKLDALLPMIQLLLSGGRIDESLNVVDMACDGSDSVFPRRLKATLLEHLDPENSGALTVCYEDILQKDPTCRRTVERLVIMHKRETYGLQSLLDMISLHLDATSGDSNVWKELAECFLKVSHIDQNCMSANRGPSVCLNVTQGHLPHGYLGKRWELRHRWWLSGHFSNDILNQESVAGDLELLCYKAACAAHMYGEKIEYVKVALKILAQRNESNMLMALREHIRNSIRLHKFFSVES
ncbi:hypothetical protein MLD38_012654 [Melastoma candidum]|uniref:Uncharacterized protein n=1 Tax=Melastoma candidum TaxID=119954 RepID=A0ACB9RAN6_9MYRT|nr:hypothetical protein MLD38_012654 [Melastoma candidum]